MSDWITDRRPTVADTDANGCVWATQDGHVSLIAIEFVEDGMPWMPTNRPKPYDKDVAQLEATNADLLEALETMVAMFSNSIQIDGYVGPAVRQARAAIAKAKGEVVT